ncbi:class I SAM-dependent methyltransferase [Peristeroidobacter agariperforans]|uniref:class I SAM-dependent methyltransferase n=1 Tax=Peristeroidobacter agariperforans TaxID=268404 RepID=UPI00101C076F|nr:class I SAM-dependent methyltransferase [Peristeroidobacter agariperforans]
MRSLLAALLLVGSGLACAAAPERYETRAAHDPDGIGKFYLGREIAHVMGPGGVPWLERAQRESEERPQLTVAALEIKPGQTVADLGAGSGYYSFRVAPLVGERGSVLAIDVEPRMLRVISERARRDGVKNITTVLGTPSDPNLEPNSVDLLFMVDVYHELEYPFEVMTKVREALKPGGRVALIEYRAEDPAVMIKPVHKMTEQQIIKELTAAGFRHQKTIRTLPLQHLVLFQK